MKAARFVISLALISLATAMFGQSTGHQHEATPDAAPLGAAKTFSMVKTLAGEWEGAVTADVAIAKSMEPAPMHLSMRVTSRGNVLVHEFQEANTPLDATKYDHPVTMLYVDSDQLNLVHYCDAGNRPHMTGKISPDGKKVEFDFADISGNAKVGHMHQAAFTFIDANHHSEDWTFILPNGQPVHAHFELHRVN